MPRTKRARSLSPELGTSTRKRKMITIAIDPGTTSTSVSYTIEGRKDEPTWIGWRDESKDPSNWETPAKFYYKPRFESKGWDFMCGCEVEEAVLNRSIPIEDVITGLKIATLVHEDFSEQFLSPIEAKLKAIGKTFDDIWYDYFKYLLDNTVGDIKISQRIDDLEWSRMEVVLLIAMPDLSEPSGNQVFTRVAKRLADRCHIVKEAVCGATTVIEDDVSLMQQSGFKVVVLDLGGGFASPTAHQVRRDRQKKLCLETIASSNSRMAGSSLINQDFENSLEELMLEKKQEQLAVEARRLNMTPEAFTLRASEAFERDCKKKFPKYSEYVIQVLNATDLSNWVMKLSNSDLEKLFVRRMEEIYGAFDELLESFDGGAEIKFVLLRGGFAENLWVRQALESHYPKLEFVPRGAQIPCPVANGALLAWRHQKAAPQDFHIGTARDEEFDINNRGHADLVVFRGNDSRRTELVRNKELLAKGKADPKTLWALRRMNWFDQKVDTAGDKAITSESWEKLSVVAKASATATYTHEQVLYYTTKKPRDHEPLNKPNGQDPQDHIKEFDDTVIVSLGKCQGWKRVKWAGGQVMIEVWLGTRVAVPLVGDGKWEIFHSARGSLPEEGEGDEGVEWKLTKEIFDPRFSHAPLV